ncbi:MAG: VCBS repeat-containing protein [Phaeodactylibacter sp.]|nr:VCBS repeat-containing protein [Phaeodactylibacter sp.]
MKNQLATFFLLCSVLNLSAQVSFTEITEGPVVNTPSDSRSCNFVDVNGDGWDDIFISNGPGGGQNNMLYLNNGDGTFSEAPPSAITTDNSSSDGATFADADNDGDLDAYVVTWYGQPNYFYLNDGAGQFSLQPVAGSSGTYSETASWGDYDNDGLADLYVTNSTDFNTNTAAIKRNLLYRNAGQGQLERITAGAWVTDAHISRSVQWTDYDNDGDIDLFVSNEENQRNGLYRNDGEAGFIAVTDNAILGPPHRSSTGSSWADIDNDGDLDLFVANYSNQDNQLFLNDGDGSFEPVTEGPIVNDGGYSFGSSFADVDNDGDLDLFVANGFGPVSGVHNFLYINQGDGTFLRDEVSIPELFTPCSYGAAWGDIDNDGFPDLVVANCNRSGQPQNPNSLFRNQGNGNNWLKVRLAGVVSNRSGIGAKVRVKATIDGEPVWQMREISAQDGYNSQNSLTVHFGLAGAAQADSLIVEWPSGYRNSLAHIEANIILDVEEDVSSAIDGPTAPEGDMLVFPNPGGDSITIRRKSGASMEGARVSVYSLEGKLLFRQAFSGDIPLQFEVGSLTAGIYLIEATDKNGRTETVKFSKR